MIEEILKKYLLLFAGVGAFVLMVVVHYIGEYFKSRNK